MKWIKNFKGRGGKRRGVLHQFFDLSNDLVVIIALELNSQNIAEVFVEMLFYSDLLSGRFYWSSWVAWLILCDLKITTHKQYLSFGAKKSRIFVRCVQTRVRKIFDRS